MFRRNEHTFARAHQKWMMPMVFQVNKHQMASDANQRLWHGLDGKKPRQWNERKWRSPESRFQQIYSKPLHPVERVFEKASSATYPCALYRIYIEEIPVSCKNDMVDPGSEVDGTAISRILRIRPAP